jgi:hypothetical protein
MKERLLDVIKWGMVLVIVGVVYSAVCPKYKVISVSTGNAIATIRINIITGKTDRLWHGASTWNRVAEPSEQ